MPHITKYAKPHIFSVAPMMGYTDRHARYFLRLLAPHLQLYTEMITTKALIHGEATRFLAFHPNEKYVALQLGGSHPKELAYCAKMGADLGYDEINLNVGCPSGRVSSGQFGACLMLSPQLVAEAVAAMKAVVTIPVTVKCRIGIDQQDSYQDLVNFIGLVSAAGCDRFIIHARKAWLQGLSPKQNREVPPLRYDVVRQVKQDFPGLGIILNGGLTSMADIVPQLPYVDGAMIGRAACANPYGLTEVESSYFGTATPRRADCVKAYLPYVAAQLAQGTQLATLARPLLGLYQGQPGARAWRRHLSQHAHLACADVDVIQQALRFVGG